MGPPLWEVVGGTASGGIIARAEKQLSSGPLPERLATGSLVECLELSGDRLRFRLRTGAGPKEGWISTSARGKDLVVCRAGLGAPPEAAARPEDGAEGEPEEAALRRGPPAGPAPAAEHGPLGEAGEPAPAGRGAAPGAEGAPAAAPGLPAEAGGPSGGAAAREGAAAVPPATAEEWRREVSRCRAAPGEASSLAAVLLDAACALLRAGEPHEAASLAQEAAEEYRKLGARWRLGVACDTVAKARLLVLEVGPGESDHSGRGQAEQEQLRRQCHREALAAAGEAVALLRQVGHPDEEKDLASARQTLAALRGLLAGDSGDADHAEADAATPSAASPATKASCHVQPSQPHFLPGCGSQAQQQMDETPRPREAYFIAGTWNDWKPAAMTWDGASFAHTVTLGEQGWESFQILAEGKWGATLYPSCADASPHVAHELLGPDGLGHAKNWTIGLHPADDAGPGMCFRVALRFDERGRPRGVSWRAVLPERVALEISADDLLAEAGLLLRSGRGPPARAARLAQEAAEVLEELGLRRRAGSAWGAAARGHLAQTAALPREGGAACAQRREHHAQAVAAAGRALARLAAPAEASEASEAEDYAGARSTLDSLLSMEIEHFVSSGAQDACAGMLQSAAAVLLDCGAFDCAAEVAKAAAMHYERIENTAQAGIAWDTKARAHVDLLWSEQGDDIGLSSRQCRSEHARAGREAAARAAELLASAGDRASRESLISARCTSARAHALDLCKGFGELWLALLRESRAPCAEGLQQTFAYALGLGRPPQYAKFDVRDAVCQAAGGFSHGEVVQDREGHEYVVVGVHEGGDGEGDPPRLWFQPRSLQRAATCSFRGLGRRALRHVLRSVGTEPAVPEGTLEQFDLAEDSDGELVALCHECLLPLGAGAYPNPDGTGSLHGECLGQVLLERAEADDADRRREVAQCKARDRHEYRIGWRPEQVVPRAEDFFQARGVRPPRGASGGGSYGLALEGGSPPRVRLIGTEDPDCAINLEYLAIALQVRMKAGVAPYFSLDTPNTEEPWQVKTFDPPWLSGTCVGEVLFQADYHLKELSIGDFEQPVMGMRSVWDFEWKGDSWRGREWFVVRSAKVFLSDDNVLMPHVEMGVEARQQVADEMHQLVDAPLTTADHPLVKYAEMFTHYFDLIAERKSVVYQLREVSRASILAKFLVDSGVCLEEFWLQAPREQAANRLELPLTKSERLSYNVLVCDGVLQEVQNGVFKSGVQLSGGVDLNIDAFDLSAPVRVHKSVGGGDASEQAPGAAAAADAAEDLARLSQRELRSRIRQAGGAAPPGPADRAELLRQLSALRSAAGADEAPPAGEAEASTAEAPATEAPGAEACAAEHAEELALLEEELQPVPLEGAVRRAVLAAARRARARASGRAGGGDAAPWERAGLDPAAASLLREVFGSRLCDRRPGQGPPAGDGSRLESLRRLVGEERDARARRRQHFLGEDFSAEAPGPLFPASWRSAFSISFGRGAGPGGRPARRPLEHDGAGAAQALGAAAPVFDRSTEDGVRFRIYRRGSVEVRTTQPEGGDEAVGAVFELCAPPPPPASTPVVKVSEFVRSAESSPAPERPAYHHFLVVETDLGDAILAESREDGSVAWVPNSPGLGELCSRSRVLRAADCAGAGATAGQVQRLCQEVPADALASSRRYAAFAFERLLAMDPAGVAVAQRG